jgi:hypothetical protein
MLVAFDRDDEELLSKLLHPADVPAGQRFGKGNPADAGSCALGSSTMRPEGTPAGQGRGVRPCPESFPSAVDLSGGDRCTWSVAREVAPRS